MASLRPLTLLVFPTVLLAQTAVLRVLVARDAVDGPAPATLVVLESGKDQGLALGFQALLRQPELGALQVPLQALDPRSEAGRKLADRLRLEPGPQWLLVAQGDQVLARGNALPPSAAFAQELFRAGFRDREKELRTYLKEHPESLEARERLLALLRRRGEIAAQRFMGVEVAAPVARLEHGDLTGYLRATDALPPADLSRAAALTPTQDLEAWSAFAQELDQAFRSGTWRELDLAFTREGRPLDAASPTLQAVYQRALPEVEAALRQDPGSGPLWDLWVWMAQALGGGRLRPLLATLVPSPLATKGQWPPERAARLLLASAHTLGDWRALQDHYQDRWDASPRMLLEPAPGGTARPGPAQPSNEALLEREWTGLLEPLLECTLRCGEPARAEAILREALVARRWPALPARAAALAARCGQGALASRWAAWRSGGR